MNSVIPFVGDEDIEESVLYKPVKSLAPIIFPNIIKAEEEPGEENTTI